MAAFICSRQITWGSVAGSAAGPRCAGRAAPSSWAGVRAASPSRVKPIRTMAQPPTVHATRRKTPTATAIMMSTAGSSCADGRAMRRGRLPARVAGRMVVRGTVGA